MKTRVMMMAMMMAIAVSANAARPMNRAEARISYNVARDEALFLSDKMAYELGLTDAQYDAVYEINLDYMISVNSHDDVFGPWWDRRNADLRYVLTPRQYDKYVGLSYFYRPISWSSGAWTFHVYSHYSNRRHFYHGRPSGYASYRGGNNHRSAHYSGWREKRPAPAPANTSWRNPGGGGHHHTNTARPTGHRSAPDRR